MIPIRKGQNPVKIPFQLKCSDRTLAAWCNEVRAAFQQLEGRIPTANVGRFRAAPPHQFAPFDLHKDGTDWFVRVRPGYVISRTALESEDKVLTHIMVTDESTPPKPLDSTPDTTPAGPPRFAVESGQSVFIKITTDINDKVENAVIKVLSTATESPFPEKGTHAIPDIEGSQSGIYYVKLFDVVTVPDSDPTRLKIGKRYFRGSDYVHTATVVNSENLGDGRPVFSELTDSKRTMQFRSLEQLITSGGANIIKELGEEEEEGDTIPFRNIRKNNSGGVPYNITASGDSVDVQLTGADGGYADLDGGEINFAGGLCTSFTSPGATVDNFNIEITTYNYEIDFAGEEITGPGTTLTQYLYVRNGRVSRTDPEDAVTAVFPIAIPFYLAAS